MLEITKDITRYVVNNAILQQKISAFERNSTLSDPLK